MEIKYCINCGNQLPPNANFCNHCGFALSAPAPVQPVIQQPEVEQPVTEQPVTEQPAAEPEEIPVKQTRPNLYTLDTLPPAPPKEKAPTPPPKKVSKWPKRGLLRSGIAILLCCAIFLLSFCALSWISLRNFATADNTGAVIEDALRNIPLIRIKIPDRDGNIPFADWLDKQLDGTLNMSVRVDPEALQIFLKESQTTALLAEHMANYMNAFFTGKHAAISPDVLADTLLQDRELLGNALYRQMQEEDIYRIVDRLVISGILDLLNTSAMPAQAFAIIRTALSWWIIAALGLVILILIIALALVDRKFFRVLGDTGICLMATGGIWGLAYLLLQVLIMAMPWRLRPFAALPNHYLVTGLIPCAIFFGAGVLLLVIKTIAKTVILRKEKATHA